MSYSFEYIDIILLAMIAGFIFLRLRGILGKKSGYEEDISTSFPHDFPEKTPKKNLDVNTAGQCGLRWIKQTVNQLQGFSEHT